MKILVTARYVSGGAVEGGSSRFMKCLADALRRAGHEVTATDSPAPHASEEWDLIICSHHDQFRAIKRNAAKKIYVFHGLIADERFLEGANRYISVSEETRTINRFHCGIDSEVIGQPIDIVRKGAPGTILRKILVIRREPVQFDPFAFLAEKYELRYSDLERPIEDQIAWADLCIALGRGALESMAQGKPVLVADNRPYIGAHGDGYASPSVLHEMERCNFSGRRFRFPVTREWIEEELAKYDPRHSDELYNYVLANHSADRIAAQYLKPDDPLKVSFGVLVNDLMRLDMVLKQSEITGTMHTIKLPETATKGLNKLLGIMEAEGADIGVLCHQDMYFRRGWIERMKAQIRLLPDSWIVAGIIGKDMRGRVCGRVHDMRIPLHFSTSHPFPHPASCFDECVIIVNLKKGFRFDENLPGFDLYGTLCVLQAKEMGGTAWIIDAFAEHYCMRPFSWYPGKDFEDCFKWIHKRFPDADRIDTTVIGVPEEGEEEVA